MPTPGFIPCFSTISCALEFLIIYHPKRSSNSSPPALILRSFLSLFSFQSIVFFFLPPLPLSYLCVLSSFSSLSSLLSSPLQSSSQQRLLLYLLSCFASRICPERFTLLHLLTASSGLSVRRVGLPLPYDSELPRRLLPGDQLPESFQVLTAHSPLNRFIPFSHALAQTHSLFLTLPQSTARGLSLGTSRSVNGYGICGAGGFRQGAPQAHPESQSLCARAGQRGEVMRGMPLTCG